MKYFQILIIFIMSNCGGKMEQQSSVSQDIVQTTKIDQQTRRRIMKTGVTAYDPAYASPGYVLYCPSFLDNKVNLIDLNGKIVHQWEMPGNPGLWGYLLPNGNLFYTGKSEINHADEIGNWWTNERGGLMLEVDWNNQIVWKHQDDYQHHDARRTEIGGAIYLTIEKVLEEVAENVQGGVPGSEGEHGMFADKIVEVDSTGTKIWEWSAWEHLNPETDIINHGLSRHEWSHGNTIVPIGRDSVLVSFRGISMVLLINKISNEVVWKMSNDQLAQQHDAQLLENGNLLVLSNGTDRADNFTPHSEVLEIDLQTKKLVWQYKDKPSANFFTPHIGGTQRLQNGNTLIIEGWFGRMFQVTSEGEVVWEFINEFRDTSPIINSFFRARHYSEEEIPQLAVK